MVELERQKYQEIFGYSEYIRRKEWIVDKKSLGTAECFKY